MYVHSLCSISALPILTTNDELPPLIATPHLDAVEPKYADYIPPMQSRRMSKGLKMALVAALECMQQKGLTADDLAAIEIGTAYGLLRDSESFLKNMTEQNETALNPTAFIQSTHNTISGTIALKLKAHVHNMTFVQKGHSFENAVLDTQLSLNTAGDKYILLGGADERIDLLEAIIGPAHTVMGIGEASSFFLVSNRKENAAAYIANFQTFKTNDCEEAAARLDKVMANYDCHNGTCPTIVWNSMNEHAINYTYKIVDVSSIVGYNPTGSALALAIGIKHKQALDCPVIVINQFKEYWSIFELQ
jgi:3-oxoacyl-[acyl-carrier-protein] synthase II